MHLLKGKKNLETQKQIEHAMSDKKKCKHKAKNIVKGTTQVNGHSLKLHFCMFERCWR